MLVGALRSSIFLIRYVFQCVGGLSAVFGIALRRQSELGDSMSHEKPLWEDVNKSIFVPLDDESMLPPAKD